MNDLEKFIVEAKNGISLGKFSPLKVNKSLVSALGIFPPFFKNIDGRKNFIVGVGTLELKEKLLKLKSICDTEVSVKPTVKGLPKGVITVEALSEESDEEVLAELESQGVIAVRNFPTRLNGTVKRSATFELTFAKELPLQLNVGYLKVSVRPFIPDPLRCFRCNLLGHTSRNCKLPEDVKVCINCGEKHPIIKGQRCEAPPKCVNCGATDHNSASRTCPAMQQQQKLLKHSVMTKTPIAEVKKNFFSGNLPALGISYSQATRTGTSIRKENKGINTDLSVWRNNDFASLLNSCTVIIEEGDKVMIPTKFKKQSVNQCLTMVNEVGTSTASLAEVSVVFKGIDGALNAEGEAETAAGDERSANEMEHDGEESESDEEKLARDLELAEQAMLRAAQRTYSIPTLNAHIAAMKESIVTRASRLNDLLDTHERDENWQISKSKKAKSRPKIPSYTSSDDDNKEKKQKMTRESSPNQN